MEAEKLSAVFGDFRTIPASDKAKDCMKQLQAKGLFKEQRDVWTLGAALGITIGNSMPIDKTGKRDTFQNVNSLDPEGIFAALMLGLYPDLEPEKRLDKLVDHAEWGIRQLYDKEQNGTLDFSKLGLKATL